MERVCEEIRFPGVVCRVSIWIEIRRSRRKRVERDTRWRKKSFATWKMDLAINQFSLFIFKLYLWRGCFCFDWISNAAGSCKAQIIGYILFTTKLVKLLNNFDFLTSQNILIWNCFEMQKNQGQERLSPEKEYPCACTVIYLHSVKDLNRWHHIVEIG